MARSRHDARAHTLAAPAARYMLAAVAGAAATYRNRWYVSSAFTTSLLFLLLRLPSDPARHRIAVDTRPGRSSARRRVDTPRASLNDTESPSGKPESSIMWPSDNNASGVDPADTDQRLTRIG